MNESAAVIAHGASFCWRPPISPPDATEPAEVEICLVNLADPGLNAPDELAADERARAARQASALLARRYTAARVSLRRLLAIRLGVLRAADITLENGPIGKPRLVPNSAGPDLRFNLSRTAEVAMIALAKSIEVGIDIEQSHPFFSDAGLMGRALASTEQRAIEALPPPQRLQAMARCWVRKEAVLKAVGIGLAYPLTSFTVESGEFVDAGSVVVHTAESRPVRVFWRQLPIVARIGFAAVACVSPG